MNTRLKTADLPAKSTPLPDVNDGARGFDKMDRVYGDGRRPLPSDLVQLARDWFRRLAATETAPVILLQPPLM